MPAVVILPLQELKLVHDAGRFHTEHEHDHARHVTPHEQSHLQPVLETGDSKEFVEVLFCYELVRFLPKEFVRCRSDVNQPSPCRGTQHPHPKIFFSYS